ncbi:MAG: hypothetical protein EXR07_16835 [Acetobacteraceae bacterium]|nr:hypothetical protein [Acetobacteraceae bacterium]
MSESGSSGLVGGHYLVDVAQPLPEAGGGLAAFAALDRRGNRPPAMALRAGRHAPVRARALRSLTTPIEGLLSPLAHGPGPAVDGEAAWYVVCEAPSGRPLSAGLRPWPEAALIELVLRPAAHALDQLQTPGLTHRAIRLDNVFQSAPDRPVVLGAAWAAPPAMHQPTVFETPYAALCDPAGRGDGRIADDVYALGVLLTSLALGRVPMAGMDDLAILHRKLELGDFTALTGGERLPAMLADLLRGMLAEDPDHRPTPALLRDPARTRGRRVAARPPAHAPRPFRIGSLAVWNNRTLALAMAVSPANAMTAIESGALTHWLRRGLGDATLAVKLEDLLRHHVLNAIPDKGEAAATLIARAIATADGSMPICWGGLAIFPDGLGPVLAAAMAGHTTALGEPRDPDIARKLRDIVLTEAAGNWANMRADREPAAAHVIEARRWRAILQVKGPAGGLPRLAYTLNPLMPCASALLQASWIVQPGDLPPALDAAAIATDADLLEPQIAAFIAARSERWLDREIEALAGEGEPATRALATLRLLSEMQTRYHPSPLPGLARWVAARTRPLVELWKNRERRAAVEARLQELAAAGLLPPMRALLEDRSGHAADVEGLREAVVSVVRLDAELLAAATDNGQRAAIAARLGQEIAAGLGLIAVAATLILAALG